MPRQVILQPSTLQHSRQGMPALTNATPALVMGQYCSSRWVTFPSLASSAQVSSVTPHLQRALEMFNSQKFRHAECPVYQSFLTAALQFPCHSSQAMCQASRGAMSNVKLTTIACQHSGEISWLVAPGTGNPPGLKRRRTEQCAMPAQVW